MQANTIGYMPAQQGHPQPDDTTSSVQYCIDTLEAGMEVRAIRGVRF